MDQTTQENAENPGKQPYLILIIKINVKASYGIISSDANARDIQELVRFADIAMFESKMVDKQNFPEAHRSSNKKTDWRRKFEIYKELGRAIEEEQFQLKFQPIYDALSLEIVSYELLLRWCSPSLGQVPTEEFIGIAEASNKIDALTFWVIRQALQLITQPQQWPAGIVLAINISPGLLRDPGFVKEVRKLLWQHQLESCICLEFEITETSPITNSSYVAQALQAFKAMNIIISLDDYGQGNTSFLNLQQGEFQKIKLDKALLWSAMNNPTQKRILEAAIYSAHSLGLKVTMEGIETEEQLTLARGLGCNYLQGYLLSKPLPAAALGSHGVI
ncbi:MAG: GGDEF domain-containing phosphodiesterase [Thiolinea sp.]